MSDVHIHIESLSALADIAQRAGADEASHYGSDRFNGGCSFRRALDLARHGWPEGAQRARAILDRISAPQITDTHSATYHDVSGSYVDVGEYVQGVPECMVNFREDARPALFAHIVVSASYNGAFQPESAMNRGIAIAAVIDALESRSIRCDVDVIDPTQGRRYDSKTGRYDVSYVHLPVKRAADPLNLDTLVFAVAHPAYLRRLMFAVMETRGAEYRRDYNVGAGYGQAAPLPAVEGAIMFETPHHYQSWTEADAAKKVAEVLAKFDADKRGAANV